MPQLTIAQALREVAQIKGRIAEWDKRLTPAVFFYEEDPPAFDLSRVRESVNPLVQKMVSLQTSVAVANANTALDWKGQKIPLAMAVRTLTELKGTIAKVEALTVRNKENGVEIKLDRSYDDDGKIVATKKTMPWQCKLPEAKRAEMLDKLRATFVELNDAVETLNHKTLITEVTGLSDASV